MRANDSPPDAPASPPVSAHPPDAVESVAAGAGTAWGESTASGVLLPVFPSVATEWREGRRDDYEVSVCYLVGPAINASAEINRHGEVEVVGRCPRYALGALYEIAEAALTSWREGGPSPESWWVTADGDAVGLDEDQVEALGMAGMWREWAPETRRAA